jgi:hypothetical protein
MVIRSGEPSILLDRENVKALGLERQLDLHIDLLATYCPEQEGARQKRAACRLSQGLKT